MEDEKFSTREYLINSAIDFIKKTSVINGILEISLIGSITTNKNNPKDIDVLITVNDSVDFAELAAIGRKLKGKTQQINHGADIFIINENKEYLGRTCHWKICKRFERMACEAQNCGEIPYLNDDFQNFKLSKKVIENVPVILFRKVIIKKNLPNDLTEIIKKRFNEITKYH